MTMTAAKPTATGVPGYAETVPCEPESARRARLLVSAALDTWGIGELVEVGTLIISEPEREGWFRERGPLRWRRNRITAPRPVA